MILLLLLLCTSPFVNRPNIDITLATHRAEFTWDWVGPEGGELFKVAVDPQNQNLAFAISNFDLWRTTNGTNWSLIDQFKYREIVGGAAVSLNRALFATEDSLYLTTDGGNSWNPVNYDFGSIYCMTDEQSDTILVVGETASGYVIHYSFDSGNTFDSLTDFSFSYIDDIYTIACDMNTTLFLGCRLFYGPPADTSAVIRSTDLGQNWTIVLSENDTLEFDETNDIEINPNNTQELFVCLGMDAGPLGVFYSSNNGNTWTSYGPDDELYLPMDVEFVSDDSILVASVFRPGIFYGWRVASDWSFIRVDTTYNCMDIDGSVASTWYCGSTGGIRKSINNGITWDDATTGIKAFTVWPGLRNFTSPVNDTMYATAIMGNAFYLSTDGGATWRRKYDDNIIYRPVITALPGSPSIVYASGMYIDLIEPDTIVYDFLISTNAGATWDTIHQISHPDSAVIFSSLHVSPSNPSLILGRRLYNVEEDSEAVYLSTDQGNNWTIIMADVDGPIIGTDTVFTYEDNAILYSIDGGLNWNTLVNGIAVSSYDYDPDDQFLYAVRPDSLVRIQLDGTVEALYPLVSMLSAIDVHGTDYLFITAITGPFLPVFMRSTDGGSTFDIDTLDFFPVGLAATPNEVLVADLGKSFWRSIDATGINIKQEHTANPQFRVYPSVFKNRLIFEAKNPITVNAKIYDVSGRLIDSFIINKRLTVWQKEIPAGVYFYELGDRTKRGKVIKIW
jgi:photosystem II stability/assembly factor-like uncharacterized protein